MLHFYPIATYEFADGVYVVAAPGRPQLVGRRLLAIQGRPIADLLRLVDPLVTYDNPLSLAAHRSPYLVTAELLHGLGITQTTERATFSVDGLADVELAPVTRWRVRHVRCVRRTRCSSTGCRSGCRSRSSRLAPRGTVAVGDDDRPPGASVYFLYNTVLNDPDADG